MKHQQIFTIMVLVSLIPVLGAAPKTKDPVVGKFQGKLSYAQKEYENDLKKIKYNMLKDYQVLLNKQMSEGDLDVANKTQKKIDFLKGKSEDASVIDMDFSVPETVLDPIFFTGRIINVAAAANGGKVLFCQHKGELLIDGNTTKYTGDEGFGHGSFPCKFEFELAGEEKISYIQFLLWDQDDRFFRYTVETSADGEKWDLLVDRSKGEWRSWQQLEFKLRKVKYARINGLYNSANAGFHVVEFEAYNRKPDKVPAPAGKSKK